MLIAGKGHEDYQIVGSERRAFRDQAVVADELARAAGMKRTLAEFARACGGRLHGADAAYSDVVSDSRTLEAAAAVRGTQGGEFRRAALRRRRAHGRGRRRRGGRALQPVSLPQIVVADTQAALTRAARAGARDFRGPLVGVAGSNGKTTAKEMTAAILGKAGECLATRGNLNNHIGVPLTLLRLTAAASLRGHRDGRQSPRRGGGTGRSGAPLPSA